MPLIDALVTHRRESAAEAVVDLATGERVSYRTLDRRIEAFADRLRRAGVGRGDTVAIILPKSTAAVVAMLATLRVGARYVPIDDTLPAARVTVLFDACAPAVTVTNEELAGSCRRAAAGHSLLIVADLPTNQPDRWHPEEEATPALANTTRGRSPDDDAYVIFTSGTTGRPKGARITHRNVSALLESVQMSVCFEPGMRYLNVAPLFFDASVVDLYSTFSVGGTVFLLPRLRMPGQLTRALEDERITHTLLVPSVLRLLLSRFSDLRNRDLSTWKLLWFGGEGCPTSLLRQLQAIVPGLRYVHGYGPTETTHSATLYLTDDPGSHTEEYLPIGRELASVDTVVVDPQLHPVVDGELGELLIAGPQVMAGYCGDPERTAAVLVSIPSEDKVFYRTGDLVVRRDDGNLVFWGRRDDAVKVSGNLVHLSELEVQALASGLVLDVHALAVPDPLTGSAIVLFLVASDDQRADEDLVTSVLAHLGAHLPSYMVPARVEVLRAGTVGCTESGKLNRQWLQDRASR
ncbi:MAG: amino acid adenylation domain-containing protein [Nocardioides sp.]